MIVVTSERAGEAFRRVFREVVVAPLLELRPEPIDKRAVARAVEESDLVIFVSGRSAYRLREEGVWLDLINKRVATAEGGKGAVMIQNVFGVKPQLVYDSAEELAAAVDSCTAATVFHHGERAVALVEKLPCRLYEFFTYRAVPRRDVLDSLPPAGIYVFFSGLAAATVAQVRPDVLKNAVVVAAGSAVAKALERYNIKAYVSPGGRIIDVIRFIQNNFVSS
ncbi:MAG: uroporphyrinogen-III synthase [Pyrobaculum sp.]